MKITKQIEIDVNEEVILTCDFLEILEKSTDAFFRFEPEDGAIAGGLSTPVE